MAAGVGGGWAQDVCYWRCWTRAGVAERDHAAQGCTGLNSAMADRGRRKHSRALHHVWETDGLRMCGTCGTGPGSCC